MKYQFSMILLTIYWLLIWPNRTLMRNTLTAQDVWVSTTRLSSVKSKKKRERTSSKCCFTSHASAVDCACVACKAALRGAGDPSRRLKTGKGTHQVFNTFTAFKVSNFDCIWYEVSVQYDSIDYLLTIDMTKPNFDEKHSHRTRSLSFHHQAVLCQVQQKNLFKVLFSKTHKPIIDWACVACNTALRGAGDPSRRLKTGKGTHQVLNSFIGFKVSNFDCIWYEVSVQYDSIDNDMQIFLSLLSLETLSPHKKFAFPPPGCPLSSPRKNMKEPLRSAALHATQAQLTALVLLAKQHFEEPVLHQDAWRLARALIKYSTLSQSSKSQILTASDMKYQFSMTLLIMI